MHLILPYVLYVLHISSSCDHANNIWMKSHFMKLLVM
jgi:hypothetical protein